MLMPSAILTASLAAFGTIGVGAAARRAGWLTAEADESLARLVVNLLLPAFILDNLLGNPALDRLDNLILAPTLGAVTICLGFAVAAAAARAGRIENRTTRRTFSFSVGMYNYGYIPIPLAVALFDRETVGVLVLHNLGVEVALWTVGILILQSGHGRFRLRGLLNGPILSIVAGVALTRLGWNHAIPPVIRDIVAGIASATIPVALLAIGAIIMDLLQPRLFLHAKRVTALAVLVRLGIVPLLMLGLMLVVPGSLELKRVIAIEAAMPCAVFPVMLSRHYRGDTETAVRALVMTSAVSIATTPLWLTFALKLIP